jgi:glutamine phosphoribosylpyrophosphate amidotransferase
MRPLVGELRLGPIDEYLREVELGGVVIMTIPASLRMAVSFCAARSAFSVCLLCPADSAFPRQCQQARVAMGRQLARQHPVERTS